MTVCQRQPKKKTQNVIEKKFGACWKFLVGVLNWIHDSVHFVLHLEAFVHQINFMGSELFSFDWNDCDKTKKKKKLPNLFKTRTEPVYCHPQYHFSCKLRCRNNSKNLITMMICLFFVVVVVVRHLLLCTLMHDGNLIPWRHHMHGHQFSTHASTRLIRTSKSMLNIKPFAEYIGNSHE